MPMVGRPETPDTPRRRLGCAPKVRLRALKEDIDLIRARLEAAKQDFEAWQARHGAR